MRHNMQSTKRMGSWQYKPKKKVWILHEDWVQKGVLTKHPLRMSRTSKWKRSRSRSWKRLHKVMSTVKQLGNQWTTVLINKGQRISCDSQTVTSAKKHSFSARSSSSLDVRCTHFPRYSNHSATSVFEAFSSFDVQPGKSNQYDACTSI